MMGVGVSGEKKPKTYSRRDSPVVTDLSTNLPIRGLIQDERTGIHALLCLWPYVLGNILGTDYIGNTFSLRMKNRVVHSYAPF